MLGVYARDTLKPPSERQDFWNLLDMLKVCETNEKIVMLKDFNAWVGASRNKCEKELGIYGDSRVNEYGESLIKVCLERKEFLYI